MVEGLLVWWRGYLCEGGATCVVEGATCVVEGLLV